MVRKAYGAWMPTELRIGGSLTAIGVTRISTIFISAPEQPARWQPSLRFLDLVRFAQPSGLLRVADLALQQSGMSSLPGRGGAYRPRP
jgi:hypothetical protein